MLEETKIKPKNERFAALKYPDFRLLWIGQFVSTVGSQMQLVALNWHIYVLTNSPVALGLIGLMRFVPIVIFSLVGGSFADVLNRKKIMLITQSILTILAIILAITTFTESINPIIIYIITALSAVAMSFDQPARQALVPNLVDRKHLANAMSLNIVMFQTSTIVGPMIAGFMLAKYNIGNIYAINAVSYLAVIASVIFMKTHGSVKNGTSVLSLGSIKEGLSFVKSKTLIWSTMILDFFVTLFGSATALFPIFARDILHVGPAELGILYAAPSIGAVIAGVVISHMGTLYNQGKILFISVGLYALAVITFGLSKSFFLSIAALVVLGAGDSVSTIIRHTIRQIVTPDYIRGRMTSVNMIFFMGGPQLGEFQAGLLAAFIGAPFAVATGGAITLAIVGIMAYAIPILRRYNNHTAIP